MSKICHPSLFIFFTAKSEGMNEVLDVISDRRPRISIWPNARKDISARHNFHVPGEQLQNRQLAKP